MNDTRNRRPLTQRDFELRLEQLQRIDRMFMSMLIPAAISLASLFFPLAFCSAEQWDEAGMKNREDFWLAMSAFLVVILIFVVIFFIGEMFFNSDRMPLSL